MRRILAIISRAEEAVLAFLFVVLIGASAAQILFRFLVNYPLAWTEELARFVFVLLVYIAASAAIRLDRHVRVEAIDALLPERWQSYIRSIGDLCWLLFTLLIALYGSYDTLEKFTYGERSPALQWPLWIASAFIPIAFLLMAGRIAERIVVRHSVKREEE